MDFMHDILADCTKIRLLTIVDTFSRESVALELDYVFKSPEVVEVLRRAVAQRGAPERIYCDNGPELISLHLDQWAYLTRVKLAFSLPVRPSESILRIFLLPRASGMLYPYWFRSLEMHSCKLRRVASTTIRIIHTVRLRSLSLRVLRACI